MSTRRRTCIAIALLAIAAALDARGAVAAEAVLLKTALDPHAAVVARTRAFADLRAVATEQSIAALAPLLADPAWAYPARSVLEALPGPAADRALLRALETSADVNLRVGLVNSLGNRRCSEAVAPLAKWMGAAEPALADATLNALGQIGSTRAIEALLAHSPSAALAAAWGDALVRAADALQRRDRENAAKAYQVVITKGLDAQVSAATIGLAHVAEDPVAVVADALSSKRASRQLAALAVIRSGEFGAPLTAAVERTWATLAPGLQVQVLSVLQDRGDRGAANVARRALAMSDAPVQAAAAQLIAVVGDATDAPRLEPLMVGEDERAVAARLALARLPGEAVTNRLVETFRKGGDSRDAALDVLIARGYRAIVPELLRPSVYADASFAPHAASAVSALGTPAELGRVLDLHRALAADQRAHVEPVIRRLAAKHVSPDAAAEILSTAARRILVGERAGVYAILAGVGGDQAFDSLTALLRSDSAEERKAAARALSNWRDTRPADLLLTGAKTEPDASVRAAAVRAATTLYAKSALGGANNTSPALVPAAVAGLRRTWELAEQRPEKNAVIAALRGLKDPRALAAADELERSPPAK